MFYFPSTNDKINFRQYPRTTVTYDETLTKIGYRVKRFLVKRRDPAITLQLELNRAAKKKTQSRRTTSNKRRFDNKPNNEIRIKLTVKRTQKPGNQWNDSFLAFHVFTSHFFDFAARPRRNKRPTDGGRPSRPSQGGGRGSLELMKFSRAIPAGRHMRAEFAAHIAHVASHRQILLEMF